MARAAARKRSTTGDDERTGASFISRLGVLVKSLFVADEDAEPSQHAREVVGILMLFASLWLFFAMLSYWTPYDDPGAQGMNWGGRLGFYLAKAAHGIAGFVGLKAR